jgi:hypothetical protein
MSHLSEINSKTAVKTVVKLIKTSILRSGFKKLEMSRNSSRSAELVLSTISEESGRDAVVRVRLDAAANIQVWLDAAAKIQGAVRAFFNV